MEGTEGRNDLSVTEKGARNQDKTRESEWLCLQLAKISGKLNPGIHQIEKA